MQPRAPVSFLSFLGPEGRAQNGVFFHLIDKIADFLHNKLFFLIAPRICIIIGPVRSIAQTNCADKNTFLSLWEMPQNGVFSLRIAHIALSLYFCTKGIFSDGPKGIECIWELCACSRERQLAF